MCLFIEQGGQDFSINVHTGDLIISRPYPLISGDVFRFELYADVRAWKRSAMIGQFHASNHFSSFRITGIPHSPVLHTHLQFPFYLRTESIQFSYKITGMMLHLK